MLKFGHILVPSVTTQGGGRQQATTTVLTNAQALALNTTPIELVPAPVAGNTLVLLNATVIVDAAGGAFTESANNLDIRYIDESGTVAATFEATGGLLAASVNFATSGPEPLAAGVLLTSVEADALVASTETADWGGGNAANTVTIVVTYMTVKTS